MPAHIYISTPINIYKHSKPWWPNEAHRLDDLIWWYAMVDMILYGLNEKSITCFGKKILNGRVKKHPF